MKVKKGLAAAVMAGLVVPGLCWSEAGDDRRGRDEAGYATSTLDSRVSRLEKRLSAQPLAEMSKEIDRLQEEVKKLRGTVEELRNGLDKAHQQNSALELRDADLETRILALTAPLLPPAVPSAASVPAASSPPAGVVTPATTASGIPPMIPGDPAANPRPDATFAEPLAPPPPPPDPKIRQRDYEQAFETLKAGKYTDAIAHFQTFVAKYPSGEFSDNAQYWLGEAHYVNRDYVVAREAFRKLVADFPQSGKVPDVELKLAFIEYENEQYGKATGLLNDVIKRHPESSAAKMAEKRLERMRQEKR